MRILSNEHLVDVINDVRSRGHETSTTYEIIGKYLEFNSMDSDNLQIITDVSDEFVRDFKRALITGDNNAHVGIYDMKYYTFIQGAMKEAMLQLKSDSVESRRVVVRFPIGHCFEAVQFLQRDGYLMATCFMRSCDAERNLAHDVMIVSIMCDMYKMLFHAYKAGNFLMRQHSIKMMIGSLHVYR